MSAQLGYCYHGGKTQSHPPRPVGFSYALCISTDGVFCNTNIFMPVKYFVCRFLPVSFDVSGVMFDTRILR